MLDAPHHTHSTVDARFAPFAFFGVSGEHVGQIFVLQSSKTVLKFDSVVPGGLPRSTRCLVVRSDNGVTVRTIEGELAVNNQITYEAWLQPNDEISCGSARLRLIRQSELPVNEPVVAEPVEAVDTALDSQPADPPIDPLPVALETPAESAETEPQFTDPSNSTPQFFADDLEYDTRSDDDDVGANDPFATPFFTPFTPDQSAMTPPADNSTTCLNPDELRKLLEPTVYSAEEPSTDDPETPPTSAEFTPERIDAFERGSESFTPESPEPQAVEFPSANRMESTVVHSPPEPEQLLSDVEPTIESSAISDVGFGEQDAYSTDENFQPLQDWSADSDAGPFVPTPSVDSAASDFFDSDQPGSWPNADSIIEEKQLVAELDCGEANSAIHNDESEPCPILESSPATNDCTENWVDEPYLPIPPMDSVSDETLETSEFAVRLKARSIAEELRALQVQEEQIIAERECIDVDNLAQIIDWLSLEVGWRSVGFTDGNADGLPSLGDVHGVIVH